MMVADNCLVGNPELKGIQRKVLCRHSWTVIESLEEAGERLLSMVLDFASGTLTRGEPVNYSESIEVYGLDPLF